MVASLLAYLEGTDYQQDLTATRQVWSGKGVLGTAGAFVFLCYLTVPPLTAVQPFAGPGRVVTMKLGLESEREKQFLVRLLGLSQDSRWAGGIRNPKVRAMVEQLACNHWQYEGMRSEHMTYMAGIIAVSALRVRAVRGGTILPDLMAGYWSYMQHAVSLLRVTLTTPAEVERDCEGFTAEYTSADTIGSQLVNTLVEVYPQYVDDAIRVLFPRTRMVVTALLEERNAKRS